jgi:hypothetical protein
MTVDTIARNTLRALHEKKKEEVWVQFLPKLDILFF